MLRSFALEKNRLLSASFSPTFSDWQDYTRLLVHLNRDWGTDHTKLRRFFLPGFLLASGTKPVQTARCDYIPGFPPWWEAVVRRG